MISAQIVSRLDSMHSPSPTNQSKNTLLVTKSANHLENFNIETFEKLFDPRIIRLYFSRTFLAAHHVYLDRRLKRTTQRCSTISKAFIRLEFWRRLYGAFRPRPNLIHIRLQIIKIATGAATSKPHSDQTQ